MEVNKPKIYTDRGPRLHDNFFFVSYKHVNSNEVFDVLNKLYEKGVNYWYDTDLEKHMGEAWDEIAISMLEKRECVGAIVFISKESCLSQACYKEIKKINSIIKENQNFKLIPIIINFNFPSELEKKILDDVNFGTLKDNPNEATILEKIAELKLLTKNDSGLFKKYTNNEYTWLDSIPENVGAVGALEKSVFYLEGTSFFTKLNGHSGDQHYEVKIGTYSFEKENDNRVIEWIAVKQEKNFLYLVTKYVIDYVVENEIDSVIRKVRKTIGYEDARESIELISVDDMNVASEQIGKFIPTDYADKNRAQFLRMNYLKSTVGYSRCNVNGVIIDKKCDYKNINCGIRLSMKIDLDKI